MGVGSRSRLCALLALGAVLATAAGCEDNPDGRQKGGIAGLTNDGPNGKLPVNSSIPGLEPPVTTGGMGPAAGGASGMGAPVTGVSGGNAAGGAGMTPAPMAGSPSGAAGNGGFGNAGSGGGMAAGTTGGAAGSSGMPMTDPDAGASDPCAEPGCGVDQPCSDSSLHCIKLDGCDHAVCITTEAACQSECDSPTCALLESYPEQITCD